MELRQTCFYKLNKKMYMLQVMLQVILIGTQENLQELNTLTKQYIKDQLQV
jgi:hypothetical protein